MSCWEINGRPHSVRSLAKRTRAQLWGLIKSYYDALGRAGVEHPGYNVPEDASRFELARVVMDLASRMPADPQAYRTPLEEPG